MEVELLEGAGIGLLGTSSLFVRMLLLVSGCSVLGGWGFLHISSVRFTSEW